MAVYHPATHDVQAQTSNEDSAFYVDGVHLVDMLLAFFVYKANHIYSPHICIVISSHNIVAHFWTAVLTNATSDEHLHLRLAARRRS